MTLKTSTCEIKRMFTSNISNPGFWTIFLAFAVNVTTLNAAGAAENASPQVAPASTTAVSQAQDISLKHLEVLIETDGVRFKVLSRKEVDRPASLPGRQELREGFFFIEGIDASGNTVHAQSLPDPTLVFYDFMDESPGPKPSGTSQPLKGGIFKFSKAQIVVSLPIDGRLKGLKISRQRKSSMTKGRAAVAGYQYRANQPVDLPEGIKLDTAVVLDLTKAPEIP